METRAAAGLAWRTLRALGNTATYSAALARAESTAVGASNYERACQFSVAGDVQQSLILLSKALTADPNLRAWAQEDPDLRGLHGEDHFWMLVAGPTTPAPGRNHNANDTHDERGRTKQAGDEEAGGPSTIEERCESTLHAHLRSDGLEDIAEDCKRYEG